jgi:hypothetical protein
VNLSPSENWSIPFDSSWNVVDSTKVKTLVSCPRRYFYEYVLGWRPDVPSNHLVFGSSVHLALEYLLLHDYSQASVLAAYDLFLSDYRKTFGPEMDDVYAPKTPQNFFAVLGKYAQEYRRDLVDYDVLYTEIAGTISVDDGVDLAFRMDSVNRHKRTGLVGSWEHKTASSTYFWAEQWPLSVQVGTYTHVLNCLFPAEEVDCVEMNALVLLNRKRNWDELLTTGKNVKYLPPYEFLRCKVPRSNEQMAVWHWNLLYYLTQLQHYFELLASASDSDTILTTFPMRTDSCTTYGKLCPYYDFCCAWPNPLQRCQEPPIGLAIDFWNPLEKEAKHEFKF